MLKKTAVALAAATIVLAGCDGSNNITAASGLTFFVSDGASIYTIKDGDALNASKQALTGFSGNPAGTLLYSMDFNPRGAGTAVVSTGLNGLDSNGQTYTIDPSTGVMTARGAPDTTVALGGKAVEIDYNPRAAIGAAGEGRVYRVTTSTGENYRRQSDSGAKVANDASFVYVTGDANAGKSVVVSGVAYTNSGVAMTVPGSTVAYVIDSQNDVLSVLGGVGVTPVTDRNAAGGTCPGATANPDCGQLRTVGALGLNVSGFVGFDILDQDTAYATAFANGGYNLYTVNLLTGAMTFVTGLNPGINPVRSFAVQQTARTP
ncbi:MAG: DUF4394 domain-containing protein [Pseudomonadota bacterium]